MRQTYFGHLKNILEAPHMIFKYAVVINFDLLHNIIKAPNNLQLLVEKFTIDNLNAPHKWGSLELNKDYAHVIPSPMKCNERVV